MIIIKASPVSQDSITMSYKHTDSSLSRGQRPLVVKIDQQFPVPIIIAPPYM